MNIPFLLKRYISVEIAHVGNEIIFESLAAIGINHKGGVMFVDSAGEHVSEIYVSLSAHGIRQ